VQTIQNTSLRRERLLLQQHGNRYVVSLWKGKGFMSVKTKKLFTTALCVGLALTALGFTCAALFTGYPTISAPDSASAGTDIAVGATSDCGGLRIVIKDVYGTVLFDSDEPGGPTEEETTDEEGNPLFKLDALFHIPENASGPLTVTATDSLGRTTSKDINLT